MLYGNKSRLDLTIIDTNDYEMGLTLFFFRYLEDGRIHLILIQ